MKSILKSLSLALLLGAAACVGATEAAAQGAGRIRTSWVSPPAPLPAAKAQRIAQLEEEAFKKAQPLQEQLATRQTELQTLWAQDNPDRQAVARKQAEIDTLHRSLREIFTELELQMRSLLTPAERAYLGGGPGGVCLGGGPGCGRGGPMAGPMGPWGGPGGRHGMGPGKGWGGRGGPGAGGRRGGPGTGRGGFGVGRGWGGQGPGAAPGIGPWCPQARP